MDAIVTLPISDFAQDVIEGLSASRKTLPCKYFYDTEGSRLFEQICELDEYYITRTEMSLLDTIRDELAFMVGSNAIIIEPGAGAGTKIQRLLSALKTPQAYVPIDISQDFLDYSAGKIRENFPSLSVMPICADFTGQLAWQPGAGESSNLNGKRVVFFPGSTIGNFSPSQASGLLGHLAEFVGDDGAIIVGFDLVKSRDQLEAAYNDKLGVTAQFNKNLLTRINRELDANFHLDSFQHEAIFNAKQSRIEMHLKSRVAQTVTVNDHRFRFEASETIHTENSYKYSNESFAKMAASAGLRSRCYWMDEQELVSLHYLIKA